MDQGRGWAGAEVASPADVRAGRRGPCPRGGDQGFAGCLETELMYLQMMMDILFLFFFVLFLKSLMDAGTATLLHFVPGDDSVGGGHGKALGDIQIPQGGWESRAR